MTKLNLVCIIFVCFIHHSRSKFSTGVIDTPLSNFEYIDRYCFVSEEGVLRYDFAYPATYAVENVYLYFDGPNQWPAVYKTDKTCREKESFLKIENYQIMNLTTVSNDYGNANCERITRDGEPWISCSGSRRFSSYRERWWYMAVGNCNENRTTEGLYLEYTLQMTNGPADNLWFHHFSADEFCEFLYSYRERWWYMAVGNCNENRTTEGLYLEYTLQMTNGPADNLWFHHFSADEFCEFLYSYRERWWYMAVGNCNENRTTEGLYLEYTLQMTNGPADNLWFHHFSADEFCEFLYSYRERWWYMAVGNCNENRTTEGLYLEYTLQMTNGPADNLWFHHFSADEFCEFLYSYRERWWYMAVGNCNENRTTEGLYLEYTLQMTNGPADNLWFHHFSADEFCEFLYSYRERWWYMAVGNCNENRTTEGLYLEYTLQMTNGPADNLWFHHFSADEFCEFLYSYRERWWYMAVGNCNENRTTEGLYLEYTLQMTNGPADNLWFHHFSADEFCEFLYSYRERWGYMAVGNCNENRTTEGLYLEYTLQMTNGPADNLWFHHFSADEFCEFLYSYRERWWYMAVGNCNENRTTEGLYLEYTLQMTNGPADNLWFHHFSADEFCEFLYSYRERWWYMAVGNCNENRTTEGLYLEYTLQMTNGPADNLWFHHFSADEFCEFLYSYRERWWYMAVGNCNENRTTEGLYLEYTLQMTNGPADNLWFHHFSADEFCEFLYSYRERWWYMAVGNCNENRTTEGLYLEYTLQMTNGPADNLWFHHFSADEFYILQVDIGFLVLELLTLVAAISVAVILRARQMLHTTYKLFMGSLTMEVLGLFADAMAYGRYARDGEGAPSVEFMGQMLRGGSRITFLLMLILMGKGFTITRGRLSSSGSIKIGIFIALYAIIYCSLFIYEARSFDPAEVLYLYESPAGYGILIMGLVGWAWFCRAIYCTLLHYPEKRGFYLRFCVFFSIWFWTGPVMVVLSNWILPNWMREKIVNGLENAICFLGFAAFMVITRPSAANRNFPYHVRTSQIDALNAAYDNTNESVSLPHHTYEMRMSKLEEVFTVTGKAVEMEERKRKKAGRMAVSTEEDDDLHSPPPPYDDCVTSNTLDA